jgi:hypothetical protein
MKEIMESIMQLGAFFLRNLPEYRNYVPVPEGKFGGDHGKLVLPGQRLDLSLNIGLLIYKNDIISRGHADGIASVNEKIKQNFSFDFIVIKEKVLERIIRSETQISRKGGG